jgi:CheY-like chemotaxis protein
MPDNAGLNLRHCFEVLLAGGDYMILCIDDEATGLMVRKMMLQSQGYEVLTALSGPEGLKLFAANPVEAVVLDYSMPGMNGDQVAAELKRLNPKIRILLLTAYVDLPEEALKWIDKRSVKGVSPTSFLADLQQLLSC